MLASYMQWQPSSLVSNAFDRTPMHSAPCQVPKARRPLVMGTVSEQPNMLDFTCAGMSSSPVSSHQMSSSPLVTRFCM